MKRIENIGNHIVKTITFPIRVAIGMYKAIEEKTPQELEMPFEIKKKGEAND
tara:strand:- start:3 stop:158 length:156 start_codon:yes stop_codon:yes gene_type:complete